KYFESVLTTPVEMLVKSFSGDGAPHACFAILPIEKDHVAPENQTLHGGLKCQVVLFQTPLHAADDKGCERMDVHLHAGVVQSAQIRFAIDDANHGPRISARSQHD